ncbi:hypothetical protein FO519_002139 [Halicephalobus sp. NKZ332]|nr:hypothetical protein FO519_002139 [Halicephalobus sp. NKZ332]
MALILTVILEIILIAGGISTYTAANQAREGVIDYTFCTQVNNSNSVHVPRYIQSSRYEDESSDENFFAEILKEETEENNTKCLYKIELATDYDGEVRFYYGLEGFYQNMRLYFRSRNDLQLRGKHLSITEDCNPYMTGKDKHNNTLPIAPCGAVANSLFNDTFKLYYRYNESLIKVPWTTKDLIHPMVKKKYINPPSVNGSLCAAFEGTLPPPAWNKKTCELADEDGGVGFENFDFMIWMQTAALPKFRKLYRALNSTVDETFLNGLPKGSYVLEISDNYPVADYDGRKRFIIAIGGLYGQKNYFLPLGFFITAVGLFCITIFLLLVKCGRCNNLEVRLERVARHF